MTLTEETIDAACNTASSLPTEWSRASPGEQLRALRLMRGISQRHLAEHSGVAQSVISRLEHGADAHWETWKELFAALGYEVVIAPLAYSDEWEGLLQDETYARGLRAEAGRMSRW